MLFLFLITLALAVKTGICAALPTTPETDVIIFDPASNAPQPDVHIPDAIDYTNATMSGENARVDFFTATLCTGTWSSGHCRDFQTRSHECRNLGDIGMEHLTMSIKLWTGSQCVFYWARGCPDNGKKALYSGNHPNVFPLGLWYSSGHCFQH